MNINKALEQEALAEQAAALRRGHDEARVVTAARAYQTAWESTAGHGFATAEEATTRTALFAALDALDDN